VLRRASFLKESSCLFSLYYSCNVIHTTYLQVATVQVKKAQERLNQTKVNTEKTAEYFGEVSEMFNIDEMFTCLRDLCEKIKAIQVGCMNYVT
jgi:hypothetical protein